MKNIKSELELIIKYIDECLEEYPLTSSEDFYTRRLAFKSVALDLIQVHSFGIIRHLAINRNKQRKTQLY